VEAGGPEPDYEAPIRAHLLEEGRLVTRVDGPGPYRSICHDVSDSSFDGSFGAPAFAANGVSQPTCDFIAEIGHVPTPVAATAAIVSAR
jgi:hypothetical protein